MLLFVNIDAKGNVIESLFGFNIIPDRDYNFFFFTTEEIASTAYQYKVEIVGMNPKLILK